MKNIILKTNDISYSANTKNEQGKKIFKVILKNLSVNIEQGKITGISGESGSGKTSFAKILTGIVKPTSGNIELKLKNNWNDKSTKPVQILFQNDGELINPYRKVKDILSDAFEIKYKKKDDYSNQINELLTTFSLKHELKTRKGFMLSGGEQQRIALARILITEPEILILDEPFSSQDAEAQANIVELIKHFNKNYGLTVICISHDLNILKNICDDVVIMHKGEIVESGKADRLFVDPQHQYTKFLIKAESLSFKYADIENFYKRYEQD